MKKVLHQFCEAINGGDATSDHVFLLRDWLRQLGFESEIYAVYFSAEFQNNVRPSASYRKSPAETHVIYHHAGGATLPEILAANGLPLIVVYHNVTPPEFVASSNPSLAQMLIKGRAQLPLLAANAALGLGVSHYNERELIENGFEQTGVLPIVLNPNAYPDEVNQALASNVKQQSPHLLFVSRIAPNKRQEDLVKLLYHLRRFRPNAHLTLVGSCKVRGYHMWLEEFIASLGLSEAVTITGHISTIDMVTYFRSADLFVSMSEHEGFGKYLIEAMYFEVPILAFAAAAVPSTLGGSGVLFNEKAYEHLAEAADLIIQDETLRNQLVATQTARLDDFMEHNVAERFKMYLSQLAIV